MAKIDDLCLVFPEKAKIASIEADLEDSAGKTCANMLVLAK